MSGRIGTFVVGVGFGYLLATRKGRDLLGKAGEKAGEAWRHPKVQGVVKDVEEQALDFAKQQGVALKDKAVDAARSATGRSADEPSVVVEPETPYSI
ncbi:YtxH domain-containing protein [Cellulomonas sp. CW35]|uniref:YtxH domain-containing protein n=1 Tax=Cellulomonas uda TaxID=1714 RepID=A0A4Y3KF19_CELUD|nr:MULTISPECIES: YtxH domain-containing protein [Cellulomonas]ASR56189.1 hypothetical protein CBP52_15005 [Cellulomonas sp. PSBB021]NII66163.1 hypothetical protein [Cellulomonas uda]GEA81635.1 hypothetical protein CUD01_20790 [Cellulomonas uda]